MFDRQIENGLLNQLTKDGVGCIVYSPLAQGVLSDKYLDSIPGNSRAGKQGPFLSPNYITKEQTTKAKELNDIAEQRNQSLSQMAISWVLRQKEVTSALVGASKPSQITESVKAVHLTEFSQEELNAIDDILGR